MYARLKEYVVCIRCGREGHQSYSCKRPILPPVKPVKEDKK